ncbi:MAG: CDP-alcohol phosphatidyltransferase family protein [Candidatus Kerfeldbacteria bacterium]|nr:CDP-alcohol phosphatidyltransferase family protein [Candidatus Kerfeldbacteria bacterium]
MNTQSLNVSRDIIKKDDGFLAYYFSAQAAYQIVRVAARTRLTPNMFTTASLVLGVAAAFSAAHAQFIYAIILLNISFIFDCCDGQLARAKGLSSSMGHWFDYHSDKIKDVLILLGFALGYVNGYEHRMWILIPAFIAISFQFMRNITTLNRDVFALQHTGKKDEVHAVLPTYTSSQLLKTLKNSSLFKLSDRVLLYTIFGALHKIEIGIILYACVDTAYAFASAYLNYRVFYKHDKKEDEKHSTL